MVVPDGIDDPDRPSGGNTYDRHVCQELGWLGWPVRQHLVTGFWTRPDAASFEALEHVLAPIPDDAVVLFDGLIASTAPGVLVPQARRLRAVVLVHMPLGDRAADGMTRQQERDVLLAARAVVTTSGWARRRLLELYELPADRVYVAEPGVAAAGLAHGTPGGGSLLCVAAVRFDKGHDVLLDALESISDLSWRCVCVGSLDREPGFVEELQRRLLDGGLRHRVSFTGARTGADLDHEYAAADLFVLASRSETYGMVVTEALARGLPVIASEVGGVPEAFGRDREGLRPGLLVPAENPVALAGALRAWLGDPALRARLRRAARDRRAALAPWSATASVIARVLAGAAR